MVTDTELVQLLKEGDESSFEYIFNLYFEKLMSICGKHNPGS